MLGDIPLPPMPPGTLHVAAAAGGVVIGVVLILRGRSLGRVVLAVLAAGAAAAATPAIAAAVPFQGVSPWMIGLAAAVTAAVVAALLARLVWTFVLFCWLCIAAGVGVYLINVHGISPRPGWPEGGPGDWAAWLASGGQYLLEWTGALWQQRPVQLALAGGLAAVAAVGFGMLAPAAMVIFTSSLTGAIAAVAGTALGVWGVREDWPAGWAGGIYLPAGAAVLLAALGWVTQGVAARRKAVEEPAAADEQPPATEGDSQA